MKRKILTVGLLVALCAMSAQAVEPRAMRLLNHGSDNIRQHVALSAETENTLQFIPMIIEIDSIDSAQQYFDELGAVIFGHRDNMYLASVPYDKAEDLLRGKLIINAHVAQKAVTSVDVARSVTGVDDVLSGWDGHDPYTGNGVVTGICDIGFDSRHAAFAGRVAQWTVFDEFNGKSTTYTDMSTAPATDNDEETHATHVANILAGNDGITPYHGVAGGSTFVATTSSLTDVGILAGIETIAAYAKQRQMPVVVNVSVGSFLGPHDGCDLVGRYLTALSDEVVICFSAGNFGERQNCLILDLDNYDAPVGPALCDTGWTGFEVAGGSDFWSSDSKKFEMRVLVRDMQNRTNVFVSDWYGTGEPEGQTTVDLEATGVFGQSSYVWLGWETNPRNGRFYISADYEYTTSAYHGDNPWARYFVCLQMRSVEAQTRVMAYADGVQSFFHVNGGVHANSDGSISNFACCPDVVAVGAWQSRSEVPDVDNGSFDWNINVNTIAQWSSWGTSGDGRKLPHFAAPGHTLVSAMSGPFYAKHPDTERVCHQYGGHRWFAQGGTSMASPFTAGVFALWLEAYPELTVADLRDIAVQTASRNFSDITDPRWGAGAIDARAGLIEVLKRKSENSVNNVAVDGNTQPLVSVHDATVDVVWPGVEAPVVRIFAMSGAEVANGSLVPGTLYLVTVTDPGRMTSHTVKILP